MTVERQRRRLGGVLLVSFGTIAAIVALSNLVANWHAQRARVEVRRALADAFASVEQVSRIGRDLDRERLLMDTHIAERDRFGMARVEARVDHVERDLYGATAAYQALIVSAGERQVWRSVESDLAALRPMIADVLALSSKNRDADARQYLEWVDARFGRVNADLARLNDSNRADVLGVLTRADREQHASQLLSAVLALIAIVLVVGVGGAATRMVGQREQQLLHYAARLETQNRELDAFAGRVAHDLRGPLTTMNLAASRIMEQLPAEASAGVLMKRGVARMERLIHDLLALSQVENQSRGAVCDPAAAAAAVREEQAGRVAAAQATLRVDVEPALVRAGEGLLIDVLSNLADNATKYARPEVAPEIEIVGRVCDRIYELSVADNGMGMSPDEARQAFTPFYRAMRASNTPGTGLGLSIVKRVAEANGGSVTLRSTLGRGTTLVLRLQLAQDGGDRR